MKKAQHPAQGRCTGHPAGRPKKSHRVRGPQAANKLKSVFCGGVYVAKNTLRGVQCRSPACGGARRGTQRNPLLKIKKAIGFFDFE